MGLNIKPSTSQERKLLFLETVLNNTDEVSKVSDEAVLSGIGAGVSKVAAKAEKDIILGISQLFPDTAFGDQLDQVAQNFGIAPRFGATGSSTYVRISGTAGTQYLANTVQFRSTDGIRFTLDQDFTIPSFGFGYAKVSSIETGVKSKVDALTINQVSPAPVGHLYVINEYKADGGRDAESDENFRIRIKDGANILARGTLAMLEQLFISGNSKVLKIYNQGHDLNGKIIIAIQTVNGSDLTQTELDTLSLLCSDYLNLNDLRPFGTNYTGVKLVNITYGYVDISVRVKINASANPDEVRKKIQVNISKYLDPRFFDSSKQKVEWDNLLEICKNVEGVDYIPDQYFYPRTDVFYPLNVVPRLRGFLMLDLNGAIIANFQGTLSPEFYPNVADFSFQATVLNSI
jgi:hypothetical protein